MSVKKATKKSEEVNVEEVNVEEVNVEEVETVEDTTKDTTKEVDVEVDTTVADVKNAPKEKNVRVKIKKDISFNFGSERYELKEGQCVNVPVAVKLHLNKFDALSPL